MRTANYNRTKFTCYFTYPSIAAVFILPSILFVTFRQMYGISYTLLGTLVLVNFCTQLCVDLVFTFFSRFFNLHKTIRALPLLTAFGLLIYAVIPWLFPQQAYWGLLVGTFIFSVSAGLCEVFISPTVAALPSDNPERDMSILHSLYGYGCVAVAIISTVFLRIFGTENWMFLVLFWAIFPMITFILFQTSPLPAITMAQNNSKHEAKQKNVGLALCAICIFLGAAAENAMTNWISAYMESALRLPKMIGDILGLATFSLLLAFTRTVYAKYGKNISNTLLLSMAGAAVCYLVASLSANLWVAMLACICTGICTSMLWPGTLILMEERFPNPGVAAYALMAAAGDFGSSIAPQGLGIVVDTVSASGWAAEFEAIFSPEQLGMKAGMLCGAAFPLLGFFLLLYMKKYFSKSAKKKHLKNGLT